MALCILYILGYLSCLVAGDLSVTVKPKMWKTGYSQTVTFTCEVEGDDEYDIYWYKGQNMMTKSIWDWTQDKYLYMDWVLATSAGEYTCIVNNSMTTAQDTATLKVVDAIFTGSTLGVDNRCKKQEEFILRCTLDGVNQDQVKWVSNYGQEIDTNPNTSPDPRFSLVTYDESEINLKITHTRTGDSGDYMCMSKISPQQIQIVSLRVYGSPEIMRNRIGFIDDVFEGEDVMLDCIVSGNPEPSVTWYKQQYDGYTYFEDFNDDELSTIYATDNIAILANNSLNIRNVSKTDQGAYQCKAVNNIGLDTGGYRLLVPTMPKVSVSPKLTTARIGESITFECDVAGGPTHELYWVKDGNEEALERGNGYEKHISLELKSLQGKDAGTYRCKAEGKAGIGEDSVTLHIPDIDPTFEMLNLLKQILEEQRASNRYAKQILDKMTEYPNPN